MIPNEEKEGLQTCSKKTVYIIKRNNKKTSWRFLLLELSSFFQNRKQQDAKVCYICGKKILKKFAKDKNYRKVGDHFHYTGKYRGAARSICNLKFNVLNESPALFHNGSIYNYHFNIKELANEFEEQFECLGENKEKLTSFSVPVKKQITKINKDGNESVVNLSSK